MYNIRSFFFGLNVICALGQTLVAALLGFRHNCYILFLNIKVLLWKL